MATEEQVKQAAVKLDGVYAVITDLVKQYGAWIPKSYKSKLDENVKNMEEAIKLLKS